MRPGLMTCSAVWRSGGRHRMTGALWASARGYTDADRADREFTEELMFCRLIS